MNRKQNGFSIIEALITMLIVSIILTSLIPVVTKKQRVSSDPWSYSSNASDIYFGLGESQSALIGANAVPDESKNCRLIITNNGNLSPDALNTSMIDFYQKNAGVMSKIGRIAFDFDTPLSGGNTAIGNDVLSSITTGSKNTGLGNGASQSNTLGQSNTAVGYFALNENRAGSYNSAFGRDALIKNQGGSNNVAIGYETLRSIITGSNNIAIGPNAGPDSDTSNQLFIDIKKTDSPLIGGNFNDRVIHINGSLTTTSGAVTASDKRLKNIGQDNNIGIEEISKLQVKNYTYKSDKTKRIHKGVIAQDLQKIMPNAIFVGENSGKIKNILYIDTNEILFTAINAIKQNYSEIQKLKKENLELKNQLQDMNKRIEKLEKKKSS
ncbi:MAG: tail fiber domain-containing protein [Candidatus Gastranaerophilales bacterium]|nr:tail fiber domain-containing protein [Candidatus Gastranaerophilales bacterium]